MRTIVLLFILALIVEYLVIPELVGASRNLYLLGRINVQWTLAAPRWKRPRCSVTRC